MLPSQWLPTQPAIAKAIIWESAVGRPIAYDKWSSGRKRQLDLVYSGRIKMPNTPPANLLKMADGQFAATRIAEDDAWNLYLSYVASSLACEINKYVPWSIAGYPAPALAILLDSRQMFRHRKSAASLGEGYDGADKPGYEFDFNLSGFSVPAPAQEAIAFLKEKGIWPLKDIDLRGRHRRIPVTNPAGERLKTVHRMIDWGRFLIHFLGDFNADAVEDHWQYRGFSPAIRILQETTRTSDQDRAHFTAGCYGTTGLFRSLLRAINIPVEQHRPGSHSQMWFPLEKIGMCHGDDPYIRRHHYTPEQQPLITEKRVFWPPIFPASELFVDETRFKQLTDPALSIEQLDNNSSSIAYEIALKYLPYSLLSIYCQDLAAGNNDKILSYFKGIYSKADLEAANLWQRMAAKVQMLGGCPVPP